MLRAPGGLIVRYHDVIFKCTVIYVQSLIFSLGFTKFRFTLFTSNFYHIFSL